MRLAQLGPGILPGKPSGAQQASGAQASAKSSPNAGSKTDAKLVNAAHEFEAELMKEFLAPLEHDSLFSEGDGGSAAGADTGSGSEASLMSFGSEAMAKAISERGGFGIATRILDHFHATENGHAKSETAGEGRGKEKANVS